MAADSRVAIQPSTSPCTQRWVLVVAVLASGMVFIDGTALNVALPALQDSLQASGPELLAIVNVYTLFLTGLLLLGGSLGDRYGRRRLLAIGIATFAGSSLLCGLAPSTHALIAARAVQGIGAAMVVPGSLAIITAFVDPYHRGRAIGIWSACTVLLTAVGPILGGLLAEAGWWRGVFFLNLPLTTLALIVLWVAIPESRDKKSPPKLDYAGGAAATLGLLGISYGLIALGAPAHKLQLVTASLGVGAVSLLSFVVIERRTHHPLLPLALFRSPAFCGANLLTLCLYTAFNGVFLFLPINLIQGQSYSPILAGAAQLPVMLLLILLSPLAGSLADRYGPRPLLIAGPLVASFGFGGLAAAGFTLGPSDYWAHFLLPLLLVGAGMGLTIAPLSATIVSSVQADHTGLAAGINSTTARLAGVLAASILGTIGVLAFRGAIEERLARDELPASIRKLLTDEIANLGHVRIPNDFGPAEATAAKAAAGKSFAAAFQVVSGCAATLAATGAMLAATLIPSKNQRAKT